MARLVLLGLVLLGLVLPISAHSQSQSTGYQMAPNCSLIPAPVPFRLICWNTTTKVLAYWSGTAFVPITGAGAGVANLFGTPGQIAVTSPTGNSIISLVNTAVTPGAYGSGTQVGTFTVDAKGRLTAAANVTITGALDVTGSVDTLFWLAGWQ